MKKFFYLQEGITEELKNVTQNTKLYKIAINNKTTYVLVQFIELIAEYDLNKALYKAIDMNELDTVSSIAITNREDIKIFLYGEDNVFIKQVIAESNVVFSSEEKKEIKLDYSYRLVNDVMYKNEEGIIPELFLDIETGESLKININSFDISEPLYTKDGKIYCDYEKLSLPKLSVKETEMLPISIKTIIDDELKVFDSFIYVSIDNTETLKNEKLNTKKDIELIANVLFEMDKAFAENVETYIDNTKDVNHIAEMWLHWIKTNRKTIDECPKKHLSYITNMIDI